MAQLGAGSAKVMRGHVLRLYAAAVSIHHVPDKIHVDAITPNCSILAYGAEYSTGAGLISLWPMRNRNGANMTALPHQIHDDPRDALAGGTSRPPRFKFVS